MAKYTGVIGYAKTEKISPGVWGNTSIIEKPYCGDVIRNNLGWNNSSKGTIDNLSIDNRISIIADSFAIENSKFMKYITYMGAKWKIKSFEIQYPRMILTMGDEYNG